MKKAALRFALLAALSPAVIYSGALAASDQTLRQAIDAYNKADYQRCTTLLETACNVALSRDAKAHYYLANALIKLNRAREARAHYEITAALAPNTALANYANSGLASLNGASRAAEIAATTKPLTPAVSSTAAAEDENKKRQEEALYPTTVPKDFNPNSIDKSLIEVKRQTVDTNFALSQVDRALKIVPKNIRDELKDFGVEVMVTPGMLEADPELSQERPRGYVHGGGYTNCPAMYRGNSKMILISERISWKSSVPRPNPEICASMLHEKGHAFDHCRNNISAKTTFAKLYQEDLQTLTNTQKNKFPYYTQGDGAGECELFAELFAFAADPRLMSVPYNDSLAKTFPKSFKFLTNVIK